MVQPITKNYLRDNWLVLSEPEDGLEIGVAWDLAGPRDTECYSAGGSTSSSHDTVLVQWHQSTGDSLHLSVADFFGLSRTARQSVQGKIAIDSLTVATAENFSPSIEGDPCTASEGFGIPSLPGVTRMLGAKSFVFSATDSIGRSVSADAEAEIKGVSIVAGASRVDRIDNTVRVSFSTHRWFAVQLTGFEFGETETVTRSRIFPGTIADIWGHDIEVALDTTNPGYYLVVANESYRGGGRTWTKSVANGGFFHFGHNPNGTRGEYYRGRLRIIDEGRTASITFDKYLLNEKEFKSERDRKELERWIFRDRDLK